MNNVLELKGRFEAGSFKGRIGAPSLTREKTVNAEHLENLAVQLKSVLNHWSEDTLIDGALVSVHYRMVVAKSNRIKVLLKEKGKDANDGIRGARFDDKGNAKEPRHIFTYYVSNNTICDSINLLEKTARFMKENCNGEVKPNEMVLINQGKYACEELSKSTIAQVIVDSYYVESFAIDHWFTPKEEDAIVTFYETKNKTSDLLRTIGILLPAVLSDICSNLWMQQETVE